MRIKTTIAAGVVALALAAPAQAERVRANDGEFVNVTTSPTYGAGGAALRQQWADFMARLEHGPELQKMTVYVAPLDEVFRVCGNGSDGCYSTKPARLTIHGSSSDPRYTQLVAAHEYGHHLDASRRNDPWDASTWGAKYWATYENVCRRVRSGSAFPGDQGKNYSRNPDEAFAEAYAVLNGFEWESQTFDDSFKPDAGALRQLRLDIHKPWTGPRALRFQGRRRTITLPEPVDGRFSATLRTGGSADLALYTVVKGKRTLLKRGRVRGGTTRLRYTICGEYPLQLRVKPRTGSGRYRLTVLEP